MNNTIIIINGNGGVGKDEFVKQCQVINSKVMNYSSINFAKKIAKECGWNGAKTEKDRKFLSDLKDLLTEYDDVPLKDMKRFVNACKKKYVFLHMREPSEIEKCAKEFNAITLLVRNNRVPNITTNHADKDVENFEYDYIIENNGSLEDLKDSAETFLKEISNG